MHAFANGVVADQSMLLQEALQNRSEDSASDGGAEEEKDCVPADVLQETQQDEVLPDDEVIVSSEISADKEFLPDDLGEDFGLWLSWQEISSLCLLINMPLSP